MCSAHTSRTVSPTRAELGGPVAKRHLKGISCSHFIRYLLLIIILETTWKLQEVILLLTSYSLLVNCGLHNSLEQSTHSNTYKEKFVPW